MKFLNKIFPIFAVLKVVRTGDLEQAPFGKHNNINRIEFRPARQSVYFMRFFYCVKNEIKILSKRIAHAHIRSEVWASALKTVRSPTRVVVNSPYWLGMNNTNKQGGATSYLKLSDTTSDRLRSLKKSLYSLFGGRGYKLLFFRSLTSFPLAVGFTLIVLKLN